MVLSSALRAALAGLLLLSLLFQVGAPAVALAKLKVAPGYKECPGGYQVKIAQDCQTTDLLFFGCMVLTLAAATTAFLVASLGGLFPPWGFVAMAAVFTFGATHCPHSAPPPPPPIPSASNLVPQGITRVGTLTAGDTQTFSTSIKNTGTLASLAGGTSRFCIDNANCNSNAAGSLGNITIPAVGIGIVSPVAPKNWVASAGNHTVHFCIVGGACSSLSFAVAAAPSPTSCTLDALTWNNGTTHSFYNTTSVPVGQDCDTGTNGSGQSYDQPLLCTNGVISGDLTGTYVYANCDAEVIVQSDVLLASRDEFVRAGESTILAWDGGNSTSCTLVGTNGLSQNNISGVGTVSTGAITQKSVFTLTCVLGSESKIRSVTVNLVGVVKEI